MTKKSPLTIAYNVFLRGKKIDTVWFSMHTAEEVRKSLINHDGYNPEIVVSSEKYYRGE
jgi:hypothetical protein